jgi:hypothetical protein
MNGCSNDNCKCNDSVTLGEALEAAFSVINALPESKYSVPLSYFIEFTNLILYSNGLAKLEKERKILAEGMTVIG